MIPLVVTLSDFGRTASENGTGRHGSRLGELHVRHGRTGAGRQPQWTAPRHRQLAGLEKEQLHEKRDLLHTTDFRDVLGELVSTHLGNPNIKTILPAHEFKKVGLV